MSEPRTVDGRYDYRSMELMCECRHKLGIHAAENDTGERPCFNEDIGVEGATGEPCVCKAFKLARRGEAKGGV